MSKKRVLIVGSSHAATLYLARQDLEKDTSIGADWLVAPANLYFETDLETGQITPPKSYFSQKISKTLQSKGGRDEGFFLADYDVIFYSALGLRPVGMLSTHPARALSVMPVSDGLLETMISRHEVIVKGLKTLDNIRNAGFTGPILCEPWIRPHRLPDFVDGAAWERFCAAEDQGMEALASEREALLVPRLKGSEKLTKDSYILDLNTPATHGNRAYAQKMIGNLLNMLN